ncbi:DUF3757 domain-containing protein [Pseudomonas mosselii]|uniref:DUF3757 domain-containing protein n=1 Tax=Pseudomonas mosselii TaxID=78327 RepID=UPI0027DC23E2|nr:DUF3757 domain-containing protein [Pseudomonas mosselii]
MLKHALSLTLPALLAGNVMAATMEFCPAPAEIQNTNGVLTARAESGDGQWLGLLKDQNSVVISFDSAIFYPADGKVDGVGRLRACTYKTSGKQSIDMRYRTEVTPDIPIRLANAPAWKRHEGPFGIIYFECRSQDLQGCAFREAR